MLAKRVVCPACASGYIGADRTNISEIYAFTVVWEIFDSKNISWVLHTHEKYLHEKTIQRLYI